MSEIDKNKNSKETPFDSKAYKHAISMIESSGGKYLETGINPKTGKHYSSAAGKYHFLYDSIKNDPEMRGITKRDFMNNPELQERIMDKALEGKLAGYTYGVEYARKLKNEFGSDYDITDLTALIHFVGAGNAREFLKDPENFVVPGALNMRADDYLSKFRKHFNQYSGTDEKKVTLKNSDVEKESREVMVDNTAVAIQEPKVLNKTGLDFLDSSRTNKPQSQELSTPPVFPEAFSLEFRDNKFKEGGQMSGQVGGLNELVTIFENGGTHEENSLGGIPQGVGNNGKINLVEEGETKWNDYIFSNAFSLDGTYTGKDGNSMNIFEDGGDLDTDKDKKKNKEESATPNTLPEGVAGPILDESSKYPLKFTKTQSRFHKTGMDIEVEDIRKNYIGGRPPMMFDENDDSVNFDMAVKDEGARAFLSRYNDPATREMMKGQTNLTDYDIDNMILRGLLASRQVGGNVTDSKASYDKDKHKIFMGEEHADDRNVESHERVHASGFDAVQGINLLDTLGNAFQQEGRSLLKKMDPDVLRYLNQPHEAYGNFVEFREKIGLKPGEKIDVEELKKRVKKSGASMENFYRAFNDENIVKALNTIAYEDTNLGDSIDNYKLS